MPWETIWTGIGTWAYDGAAKTLTASQGSGTQKEREVLSSYDKDQTSVEKFDVIKININTADNSGYASGYQLPDGFYWQHVRGQVSAGGGKGGGMVVSDLKGFFTLKPIRGRGRLIPVRYGRGL